MHRLKPYHVSALADPHAMPPSSLPAAGATQAQQWQLNITAPAHGKHRSSGPRALIAQHQHRTPLVIAHAAPASDFRDGALATQANVGFVQGTNAHAG